MSVLFLYYHNGKVCGGQAGQTFIKSRYPLSQDADAYHGWGSDIGFPTPLRLMRATWRKFQFCLRNGAI